MEVTSIRMNLLNNAGGIKAIGSFSLDDAFAILQYNSLTSVGGTPDWNSLS